MGRGRNRLPLLGLVGAILSLASLVAIEDSIVGDLYVELAATLNLKHHKCSNLIVEKVIGAARIYKNDNELLLKESSNFHHLRVGVTDSTCTA
ncbi:hypothetical protein BHE74_00014197 [Ensete ventricosum]|nr:hypothetical protein GW17_00038634 [Ensete ventricosum]RWW77633.1 hypothetical protein BHE74_00014197 [Ensete ventricosum]